MQQPEHAVAAASHRAAEAQLQALFEQAPEGIFVADLDGRYTDVNGAGCRMLGYAREEIVGRTIVDLIAPEDVPRLWQERERMVGGEVQISEWCLRRKDGAFVDVEISAKILPDGRWQAFVRDITERKAIREALVQSRGDLTRAQAVSRTGSWRLDVRKDELLWTDENYRIFGVPLGTPMTYEGFLGCIHPDDRALVDGAWKAALLGAPYDIEHRVVADGQTRWVRERADLEFDAQGGLIGGIGTTQDIDDRHRLEERLAAAEARSRAVIEMSLTAIVTVDDDQRIVTFNRAAEEVFGWTEAEILGRPLDVLLPERFRERHRAHVRAFAASGVSRRPMAAHRAIVGLRRSGEEFPAEGGISQVEVGGRMMTVMLRDVTEEARLLEEEAFLSEVGALLPSSMDEAVTLDQTGQLAVRTLADVCVVDLVRDGHVDRWKVFVRDPRHRETADKLERVALDRGRPHLASKALDSREAHLEQDVSAELLESMAQGPYHLSLLRELEPKSIIGLPLVARDRLLGALVLISSRRRHDPRDLRLGRELASRAALALDNAGLLRASERANAELRDTVARLEAARRTIRSLTDLLPVCAWCRRVRDDEAEGRWMDLETYLQGRTQVTHGMCPDCARGFNVHR